MRLNSHFGSILLCSACLVWAGCADSSQPTDEGDSGDGEASASVDHAHAVLDDAQIAIAVITPTEGNTANGVVTFTQVGDDVQVVADVEGLTPNAKHAIHIHQFGDLTAADGTSLGGHYNPAGHQHGGPKAEEQHGGDLGNLTADGDGKAHYELTVDNITIGGSKNPILGRGVVIHGGEDDFTTQPTGAAGPRIGVGAIGVRKPAE